MEKGDNENKAGRKGYINSQRMDKITSVKRRKQMKMRKKKE